MCLKHPETIPPASPLRGLWKTVFPRSVLARKLGTAVRARSARRQAGKNNGGSLVVMAHPPEKTLVVPPTHFADED